jgi:hypothetical protein
VQAIKIHFNLNFFLHNDPSSVLSYAPEKR